MWQPSASLEVLKQRASLLAKIRRFMADRDILEVETPVLSHAGNTDPNLNSFTCRFKPSDPAADLLYLHTSPEFAMKRLLAADSGPIYQICRVFRDEELGRQHQPEFTMLEWYQPGFDHHVLMDEIAELLVSLGFGVPGRRSYISAFEAATGRDPYRATDLQLQQLAQQHGLQGSHHHRSLLLDFLFSTRVMPGLGQDGPEFIVDFPVCQAALARIREDDPPVAERFELLIRGMEIANGFHELTSATEQRARFSADNRQRQAQGRPVVKLDEQLLAALAHGLPDCAGVAVGIDRLLMQILGYDSIDKVVTFTFNQA